MSYFEGIEFFFFLAIALIIGFIIKPMISAIAKNKKNSFPSK